MMPIVWGCKHPFPTRAQMNSSFPYWFDLLFTFTRARAKTRTVHQLRPYSHNSELHSAIADKKHIYSQCDNNSVRLSLRVYISKIASSLMPSFMRGRAHIHVMSMEYR